MAMKFMGAAIMVADVARSRQFYEGLLGQTVEMDNGPHVAFAGGFSIWQKDHAHGVIFGGPEAGAQAMGRANLELYFESETLEQDCQALAEAGVEAIHGLSEAPWRQLTARFKDPDGHVVELAEPLPRLVRRLLGQGLSLEDVAGQTFMDVAIVRHMAEQ